MGRRSRLELYFHVLDVINRGTYKPTQIMYKTNLSWASLHEIFETLKKSDFLRSEKEKGRKRYYITEKGKNALEYYMKSINDLAETETLSSI